MTATQAIYRAYRYLGYLRGGMTAPTDYMNDGLDALNDMLSSWRTQSLIVYAISDDIYTLVTNQQTYTIGPVAANFTAERPTWIKDANIILNNLNPVVRQPMEIIRDSTEWSEIRVRTLPNAIPLKLYYSPTTPNGTIFLWPGPLQAYQLELFTWKHLPRFADLTTNYDLPPGYEEAIKYNLAVALAPMTRNLGAADESRLPMVIQRAGQTLALIKSHNATTQRLYNDTPQGVSRRSGPWNWLTGNLGGPSRY